MFLKINPKSNVPIWEQIVHNIKEMLVRKLLKPGEKLPSVRELATLLVINPNTVSKAYQELERLGIIETVQGKGTFIAGEKSENKDVDTEKIDEIQKKLKQIAVEAAYLGLSKEDLTKIIQKYYDDLK